MIGLMAPLGVSIATIMMICVPATLLGIAAGAIATLNKGKELADDPEYQRRLVVGLLKPTKHTEKKHRNRTSCKTVCTAVPDRYGGIVLLGLMPGLRSLVETANAFSRYQCLPPFK
ncbi:MAG: anaerobic C4-dicarboxylate transporter family protein [Candidatus Malihini olakiniferum]